MSNCYLCGISLESYVDSNTKNHYEHIIPQSIGGQLKIEGILCKKCGGESYLGGKVDKPFCDIFSLITERLDIKRDRNTKPVSLDGKLVLLGSNECIDVSLKKNVLSSKKPFHKVDKENKTIYIFANGKVAKHYRFKVEKELQQQLNDFASYKIEIISTLNEYLGVLELPFNLDNEVFKNGFTKMAIEFALSKGIDYSVIQHLVDRENRTFKNLNNVFPYYPIAKIEEMIEYIRSSIDNNYMSHSLVLFSQRQIDDDNHETKQLYCFIELFGTFQYFVELNSNYLGEDIEPITYSQRIIKAPNSDFKISLLRPKYLSVYLNELGLSYKDIEGFNDNQIRTKIEHLYSIKNKYEFDYTDNAKRLVEKLLQDAILNSRRELIEVIPGLMPHFYWNLDNDDFHITFFRSRYEQDGYVYSIIPEIHELYQENPTKLKRYSYFKFEELGDFINENKDN